MKTSTLFKSQTKSMGSNLPNIDSSLNYTAKVHAKIKTCFNATFKKHEAFLACWGSVARGEMAPLSDLDLIIVLSKKNFLPKVQYFRKALESEFKNKIDLLEAFSLETLQKIASIDGTDRQALLFAKPLAGSKQIKNKFCSLNKIRKERDENLREAIHTIVSLNSTSNTYVGQGMSIKFSYGYFRYATTVFTIFKLLLDATNHVWDTRDAVQQLVKLNVFKKSGGSLFLKNFDFILMVRNVAQILFNEEKHLLTASDLKLIAKYIKYTPQRFTNKLARVSRQVAALHSRLELIIYTECRKNQWPQSNVQYLQTMFNLKKKFINSNILTNTILSLNNEVLSMFLAHRTRDPHVLERLYHENVGNWYIIYGIAQNENASSQTLLRLVKPAPGLSVHIQNLYDSFAWRNVRLYVARNKAARKEALLYIMHHKNSRPMDVAAATKSLNTYAK
jgi:predicted nucleotidyltransferase